MLHRLAELDELVREGYDAFDFKRVARALIDFMNVELSAFYFDIRKDALYCDAPSSPKRKAAVQVVRHLFDCLGDLAGADAALHHGGGLAASAIRTASSVHLEQFPDDPGRMARRGAGGEVAARSARCAASSPARWKSSARDKTHRLVAGGRAGRLSSTDAEPDAGDRRRRHGRNRHHQRARHRGRGCAGRRFRACRCAGRGRRRREGEDRGLKKCARSWRYTADVGSDPAFPDVSARDAGVLHELEGLGRI